MESGPEPGSVGLGGEGTDQGAEVEIRARWLVAKAIENGRAGLTATNEMHDRVGSSCKERHVSLCVPST